VELNNSILKKQMTTLIDEMIADSAAELYTKMSKQQHSQDKTVQACVAKSIGSLMSRIPDMESQLPVCKRQLESIQSSSMIFHNDLSPWRETTFSAGKTWTPDSPDARLRGVDGLTHVISHIYTADRRRSRSPSIQDYIRPQDIGILYIRLLQNVCSCR
jgi:hypothetical protein